MLETTTSDGDEEGIGDVSTSVVLGIAIYVGVEEKMSGVV